MSKNVLLDYIDDYNILEIQHSLEKAFFSLDIKNIFKPKMKVLIKVCMPYSVSADCAESTHPAVVGGLVNLLSSLGVKCIVADSPYKKYSLQTLDQVYLNTGMLEVANLTKCELNRNLKTFELEHPNGVITKSLTLLDVINDVDAIINVGKIKVDDNLGYFGACANMFGLVPGEKKTLVLNGLSTLEDFNNYIIDIMEKLQDKLILNILDGVVAMEKDKTPRMLYCLGISENAYSLDASIIDVLEIDKDNTILKQATERKYFNSEKPYKLLGNNIQDFKLNDFALPEFTLNSPIHKNENERQRYYKNNQARPSINDKKCKGCSICSKICPTKAISMKYDKNGELYAEIDYKKCIMCKKCITACPYAVAKLNVPTGFKEMDKEIKKFNID